MFTSEFNERSRSNPLCDFRLGTVATSDHETPLTEASAGDRRAIADPDQAGQVDISVESQTARALRTPEPPTDAARMAHHT